MKRIRKISNKYYLRQITVCFLSLCMFFGPSILRADPNPAVNALPNGVISSVGIDPLDYGTPGRLNVTQTVNEAIINWQNFDIGANATVQFFQPGANAAVLNRIHDGSPTGIMGNLVANGRVFVINPAGIVFGSGASINVAQLVASSLNISDDDFNNGIYQFDADNLSEFYEINEIYTVNGNGSIINHGIIGDVSNPDGVIPDGVILLGKNVINTGTIKTKSGGFVIMAAGDRVILGQPGSKIVVEMNSAVDGGDVINEGSITANEGQIILAAGDIYSVPLHPQLLVNSGTVEDPIYLVEDQPIRVETGTGSVIQGGIIQADGTEGKVILTAGDEVILTGTSATSSIDGKVITYAYDFSDKLATTYFNEGATIAIGSGFAAINGNHVLFAGNVDASLGAILQVDPVTLMIADTMPVTGPELDTLYEEEHVEYYSQGGVNLDLAADELITVEYMSDGEILGGSGDITLRNVFDDGGIYFEQEDEAGHTGPRTTIHTTAGFKTGGGDIFMLAGSGGITAGDLLTDTLNNDKISEPGRIRLLTINGGDIEVGSMVADGGSETEISAISGGDLTVLGEVLSENFSVPKLIKEVGFARICLIAMGNINVDAEDGSIEVDAHGKYDTIAEIIICAGKDINISNLDRKGIRATSQASENSPGTIADALVVIGAGGNKPDPATITINGTTYDSSSDTLTLPVYLESKAAGSGYSLRVSPSNNNTKTSENTWEYEKSEVGDYDLHVKLTINDDAPLPPGNPEGPCHECPKPEGLPPVPNIFWIVDDAQTISWSDTSVPVDVLANDATPDLYDGEIFDATTPAGGTWTIETIEVEPGVYAQVFKYTPPEDAVFTWDGIVDGSGNPVNPAIYTDIFTYKARDAEGNESLNTATVTITVTNFLPVAVGDSDTIHMSTADNPTSASFDLSMLVIDPDGTPGDLIFAKGGNDAVYGNASVDDPTETATYEPYEGFVGNDDFDYTVTDSSINYQGEPASSATLEIEVGNAPPTFGGDLGDVHMNTQVPDIDLLSYANDADGDTLYVIVDGDLVELNDFINGENISLAELKYDGVNWIYTPADGYVGGEEFIVKIWDGQYDYVGGVKDERVLSEGSLVVNMTNTRPEGYGSLSTHMDTPIEDGTLLGGFSDDDGDAITIGQVTASSDDYNQGFGGDLEYNGTPGDNGAASEWDYDPDAALPGYVGDDEFDVDLWDGQYAYIMTKGGVPEGYEFVVEGDGYAIYRTKVFGEGIVNVELTNTLPSGESWFGAVEINTPETKSTLAANGFTDAEGDFIRVVPGLYPSEDGTTSTLRTFKDKEGPGYTYTPETDYIGNPEDDYFAPGYEEDDTFIVGLWDGQYDYVFFGGEKEGFRRTRVTSTGTVYADVIDPPPAPVVMAPVAPLAKYEIPKVEGCPVLMQAAAMELGVAKDTIQISLGSAIALNPTIQACRACETLVDAASILRDNDGSRLAAMIQVFNEIAPADAPFTPEMQASIATAFANNLNDPDMSQYATVMEYIDAFVEYVTVLDTELGSPVGDSVAFAMEKYGTALTESENPNIGAYVAGNLAGAGL